MSDLNNVINELKELTDFIVNNDSYLRGKLKDKGVDSNDEFKQLEKSLDKNKDNEVVYNLIKEKLIDLDSNRGKMLMKKYGKLIFKDRVYNNIMGIKKKK